MVVKFAKLLIIKDEAWYESIIKETDNPTSSSVENSSSFGLRIFSYLKKFAQTHQYAVRLIFLWFLFALVITIWRYESYSEYGFIDALYFAMSVLTTLGQDSLEPDAPKTDYIIVGFFATVGVPINALCMSAVASIIFSDGNVADLNRKIQNKVKLEEARMMKALGLITPHGVCLCMCVYVCVC